MGCIYMLTGPTGGKYIGQTRNSATERFRQHVKASADENSRTYNSLLHKKIREYGADNFKLEVLIDNVPNEKLNELEIFCIAAHRTFVDWEEHGYNLNIGGGQASSMSEETRKRYSECKKGRKPKNYESCIMGKRKGIKHSPETKKKISELQKFKIKIVGSGILNGVQYDNNEFWGFKECAEFFNMSEANINKIYNGKVQKYKDIKFTKL